MAEGYQGSWQGEKAPQCLGPLLWRNLMAGPVRFTIPRPPWRSKPLPPQDGRGTVYQNPAERHATSKAHKPLPFRPVFYN